MRPKQDQPKLGKVYRHTSSMIELLAKSPRDFRYAEVGVFYAENVYHIAKAYPNGRFWLIDNYLSRSSEASGPLAQYTAADMEAVKHEAAGVMAQFAPRVNWMYCACWLRVTTTTKSLTN